MKNRKLLILPFIFCLAQTGVLSKEVSSSVRPEPYPKQAVDIPLFKRYEAVGDFGGFRQNAGRRDVLHEVLSARELEKAGRWDECINVLARDLLEASAFDDSAARAALVRTLMRYASHLRTVGKATEAAHQRRRAAFVDPSLAHHSGEPSYKCSYPEPGKTASETQALDVITRLTEQLFARPQDIRTRKLLACWYVVYGDLLSKRQEDRHLVELQYRSSLFVHKANRVALSRLGLVVIGPNVFPRDKSPLPP